MDNNKTYQYTRKNIPPPFSAEHPNAMACPACKTPVWQTDKLCKCGYELGEDKNN